MKKSMLVMSLLLVSQVSFAGFTRTVLATCNQVIGSNQAAEKQISVVKTVEVASTY